jgi:hypothetical protein
VADDPGVRAEARHAADAARRQLDQLDRLQQWSGHPCDPVPDDTWPKDSEPRVS